MRHAFSFERHALGDAALYQQVKHTEADAALPRNVSTDIVRQLDKNGRACCAAGEASREDPSQFTGRPNLPRYQDKTKGRFLLSDAIPAISRRPLAHGRWHPSGLDMQVQTTQRRVKQARMVPRSGFSVVEIVSEKPEAAPAGNPALEAALDLGVDPLAALTSTHVGFAPRLVNGRVLTSSTPFYNKRRAEVQEALGHPGTRARMDRLTTKRTPRITPYLPAASKTSRAVLVSAGIGTVVSGKHPLWKHAGEMGPVTTQHFVPLPHARLIEMLTSKADLAGITGKGQEEPSTRTASVLDRDPLPI